MKCHLDSVTGKLVLFVCYLQEGEDSTALLLGRVNNQTVTIAVNNCVIDVLFIFVCCFVPDLCGYYFQYIFEVKYPSFV